MNKRYFPEMYYSEMKLNYELLGIENMDGVDCYVLKMNIGEDQSIDYYDVKTFLKLKSLSISKQGESVGESSVIYSDYKEVNGFLFPHKTSMNFGPTSLNGEVKEIKFNEKFDLSEFE